MKILCPKHAKVKELVDPMGERLSIMTYYFTCQSIRANDVIIKDIAAIPLDIPAPLCYSFQCGNYGYRICDHYNMVNTSKDGPDSSEYNGDDKLDAGSITKDHRDQVHFIL